MLTLNVYLSVPVLHTRTVMSTEPFAKVVSALSKHMMTGIPSCSGFDVIPNAGLRNAGENSTVPAK